MTLVEAVREVVRLQRDAGMSDEAATELHRELLDIIDLKLSADEFLLDIRAQRLERDKSA